VSEANVKLASERTSLANVKPENRGEPGGVGVSESAETAAQHYHAMTAKTGGIGVAVAVIDDSFAKLRLFKITEFVAAAFLLAVLAVFTLFLGGG